MTVLEQESSRQTGIYVLTDDSDLSVSTLSYHISSALRTAKRRPFFRDLSQLHLGMELFSEPSLTDHKNVFFHLTGKVFNDMIEFAWIESLISFNTSLCFYQNKIPEQRRLKQVLNFWTLPIYTVLDRLEKNYALLDPLKHDKIQHIIFHPSLLPVLRSFGINHIQLIEPAFPSSYLRIEADEHSPNNPILFLSSNSLLPENLLEHIRSCFSEHNPIQAIQSITMQETVQSAHFIHCKERGFDLTNSLNHYAQPDCNGWETALTEGGHPIASLIEGHCLREAIHCLHHLIQFDTMAAIFDAYQTGNIKIYGAEHLWPSLGIPTQQEPTHFRKPHLITAHSALLHLPDPFHTMDSTPWECTALGRPCINPKLPKLENQTIPSRESATHSHTWEQRLNQLLHTTHTPAS